jgi:hypothetical protein
VAAIGLAQPWHRHIEQRLFGAKDEDDAPVQVELGQDPWICAVWRVAKPNPKRIMTRSPSSRAFTC